MVTEAERDRVKSFFADPGPYLRNNPYVDLRAEAARRLLPWRAGMSVLDLGCGDGRISIPLVNQSGELLLVDSSARMLDLARTIVPPHAAERIGYECVDLMEFRPNRQFDIVLCIGVLAHVPSPTEALGQIAQLVAPHGCALIQITDDAHRLGRLTHRAGSFSRKFLGTSAHALNHMTLESTSIELNRHGLRLTNVFRYVFVPGLRRLPVAVTRTIVRALNRPLLSRRGGEVLALFNKS